MRSFLHSLSRISSTCQGKVCSAKDKIIKIATYNPLPAILREKHGSSILRYRLSCKGYFSELPVPYSLTGSLGIISFSSNLYALAPGYHLWLA